MTDDADIYQRIKTLVEEEHELDRSGGGPDKHERRVYLEEQLDQCWDLLRQRQGLRDGGGNPDDAEVRPESVVENYRQ